jgi:hypothetical protein
VTTREAEKPNPQTFIDMRIVDRHRRRCHGAIWSLSGRTAIELRDDDVAGPREIQFYRLEPTTPPKLDGGDPPRWCESQIVNKPWTPRAPRRERRDRRQEPVTIR